MFGKINLAEVAQPEEAKLRFEWEALRLQKSLC